MTEEEAQELEARKLAAVTQKAEQDALLVAAEVEKARIDACRMEEELSQAASVTRRLQTEAEQAVHELNLKKTELRRPWYRAPVIVKSASAGLALAVALFAYGKYVFVHQENQLINQKLHADFLLIEQQKKHETNIKKLELLQTIAETKLDASEKAYAKSIKNLETERKKNHKFQQQLTGLEECVEGEGENCPDVQKEIVAAKSLLEKRDEEIGVAIALAEVEKSTVQDVAEIVHRGVGVGEDEPKHGWIYLGYRPPDGWSYRTVDVQDEQKVYPGDVLVVEREVVLRDAAPNFGVFGYKFGNSKGYVAVGEKVWVDEIEKVGINKEWARIETLSRRVSAKDFIGTWKAFYKEGDTKGYTLIVSDGSGKFRICKIDEEFRRVTKNYTFRNLDEETMVLSYEYQEPQKDIVPYSITPKGEGLIGVAEKERGEYILNPSARQPAPNSNIFQLCGRK